MFPDIPKSLGEKAGNDEDVRCVHVCDDSLSASASVYAQNERVTLDFINTNMKQDATSVRLILALFLQTEQTEQIKGINVKVGKRKRILPAGSYISQTG